MCINAVAHRGQNCLTGRTTTNGPQGAWLPHGEDNSPKGLQRAWLPHGEDNHQRSTEDMAASLGGQLTKKARRRHGCLAGRFFYFTLTGYLTLIASACPGAGPPRLVLPPLLKGLKCWCLGGGPVVPVPSRPSWNAGHGPFVWQSL